MREPTNTEERLMILGGFETLEEYLEWLNTPSTEEEIHAMEEPDWEEIALREIGCFDSGSDDDNDPVVLEAMLERADWWLEEDKAMKARKIELQAQVEVGPEENAQEGRDG